MLCYRKWTMLSRKGFQLQLRKNFNCKNYKQDTYSQDFWAEFSRSSISILKTENSLITIKRAKVHLGISKYHRLSFPQEPKTLWSITVKKHLLVLIIQLLFLPSLLRAIIISWQITLIISWSSAGLFLRINCWSARYNWLQLCCTTFRENNQLHELDHLIAWSSLLFILVLSKVPLYSHWHIHL